jgi:predicted ATPase/DNA-binding XRE family transcriptional regulator
MGIRRKLFSKEAMESDERPVFGLLLRKLRLSKGLSQEALAERARLSTEAIGALERGDRMSPQRQTLALLIDALELEPRDRLQLEAAAIRPSLPRHTSLSSTPAEVPQRHSNLPLQLTSFVGRTEVVAEIESLLGQHRLVTLVGAGGIGKTRCAIQIGADLFENFGQDVCLADLAPISDSSLVARIVARALDVQESPKRPVLETLLAYLERKKLLLILDNCEHVIEEARSLAAAILHGCAGVRILATSREGLNIAGEHLYRIPSLSVPPSGQTLSAQDVLAFGAPLLFKDRASSTDNHFALDDENATYIADICGRLDGIPLAIELAAARLKVLSPRQLAQKLNERFRVLTGNDRSALPRHQTMRALIDWSYDLLSGDERALFRKLSIFAGSFTLESTCAVCGDKAIDENAMLDLLSSLIDKSLVQAEQAGDVARYRLLESTRQYAREKLTEAGEFEAVARAHAAAFLALADPGIPQAQALDALEQAHPDVICALQWALENDYPDLPSLARKLVAFWEIRGYLSEGARYLEAVADSLSVDVSNRYDLLVRASGLRNAAGERDAAERDAEKAVALSEKGNVQPIAAALGALAAVLGDSGSHERALELYERALSLEEQAGNTDGTIACLINCGIAQIALSRFDAARRSLLRAIPLTERAGRKNLAAWAYGALGNAEHQSGDLVHAFEHYSVCLQLSRSLGFKAGIAQALNHMAQVALLQNNLSDAHAFADESLAIASEHDLSQQLSDALDVVARLMTEAVDDTAAARLFGAVDALRARIRFPFTELEQKARADAMVPLLERHDPQWLRRERDAGGKQPLETILRLARDYVTRTCAGALR